MFSIADEVAAVTMRRPHVVILGAGASRAAFPRGDKNGKRLPVMKDFVDVLGLRDVLREHDVPEPYDDFEGLYSDLASHPEWATLKGRLEQSILDYFRTLELPDKPTLYDHLVLSLRPKDVIATFNWDPFLWLACARNYAFSPPPTVFFLHGNVATAHCRRCRKVHRRMPMCPNCGDSLVPTPLLFPVKNKDYTADASIAAHWDNLQEALKVAWALTIFGYGAPQTDVDAIRLMKNAWGPVDRRNLEETEIIDIRNEADLSATWAPFIHTHHYRCVDSFYDSLVAKHPRRSGEALWACLMDCLFLQDAKFPRNADFPALYEYLRPRLEAEKSASGMTTRAKSSAY